jgi:hypothetical protein
MFDMAFSPTGQLYAVGGPTGSSSQLYRLTVNYTSFGPVDVELIGAIRVGGQGVYVNSLDFARDGTLYATGYDGGGANALFRIDPVTASATVVTQLGSYRSAGDLEFDEFGYLYFTTENARLVRVDLTSGNYQDLGYIVFSDFFGLSYGPGPVLHGFRSNGDVYRIDTQTGLLTYVTRLSHSYLNSVYGAAMIYPGPLNLGPVEFVHRPGEPIVLQEMWYRIQTVRDAIFTVETYGGSANTKVTLYQRQADGTLNEIADAYRRVDQSVSGPTTFYVQISRAGTVLNVRMANLYKPLGNGALIYGTSSDDTFAFQAGTTYAMTINGLTYSSAFDSRRLVEISFQGGLGSDQVTFGGGTQWETATINLPAGTGELRSSKYVVQASEAEHFTYTGGGGLDTADIVGTASDEQVTVSYRAVSIRAPAASASVSAAWRITVDAGGGSDSVSFSGTTDDELVNLSPSEALFSNRGETYQTRVLNAESFELQDPLGTDQLTVYGSAAADGFELRSDLFRGGSTGYSISATGFENIVLYGTPGHQDYVKMYSKGGVLDSFQLRPGEATVAGGGRSWQVFGFDRIEAFGNSYENDQAFLYGHPSRPGVLTATSTYATLSGSDFYLRAASVRKVEVNGSPADTARFYDGPGNDLFEGQDHVTRMVYGENPDHFVQVIGFGLVTGYASTANGGRDIARWNALPGQVDTFYAKPREATLFGLGYRFWAVDFERVEASAQAADGDVAYLLDSEGSDLFNYYPTPANPDQYTALAGQVAGRNFENRAIGFAKIYAYSTAGGHDIANLYDSSLGQDTLTVTPTYAALSGSGFYGRAWGFERVFAYASADGFANSARLYTSASGDVFEGRDSYARLLFGGNPLHGVTVTGYRYVTAYSQGGTHTAYFYGIPNVTDTLSAWFDTRTVARYGAAVYNRTVGFSRVIAYGDLGENDRAIIYDSPGNDHIAANGLVNPQKLTASGTDMVLELEGFGFIRAEASRGGTDTRAIYNRALLDFVLEDVGSWIDI